MTGQKEMERMVVLRGLQTEVSKLELFVHDIYFSQRKERRSLVVLLQPCLFCFLCPFSCSLSGIFS